MAIKQKQCAPHPGLSARTNKKKEAKWKSTTTTKGRNVDIVRWMVRKQQSHTMKVHLSRLKKDAEKNR